jgi:hypothetical protein
MIDLRHLSIWQRIHRRIALLGGSYRHPDGRIEFDFEAAAGIDGRNDSEELQEAKLDAYQRQNNEKNRFWYGFTAGLVCGAALIHYYPKLWPF